jgi:hypothetical protein
MEIEEIGSLAECPRIMPGHHPAKPMEWFAWRYGSGAPWPYRFFLLKRASAEPLLIVARVMAAEGATCLRIVDCLGDWAAAGRFAPGFLPLLAREAHEYLELTVGGPDLSAFEAGGFLAQPEGAIVPSYFDPFLKANAALGWTIKLGKGATPLPAYIFRGDGDQDRPNRPGAKAPSPSGRPA